MKRPLSPNKQAVSRLIRTDSSRMIHIHELWSEASVPRIPHSFQLQIRTDKRGFKFCSPQCGASDLSASRRGEVRIRGS